MKRQLDREMDKTTELNLRLNFVREESKLGPKNLSMSKVIRN